MAEQVKRTLIDILATGCVRFMTQHKAQVSEIIQGPRTEKFMESFTFAENIVHTFASDYSKRQPGSVKEDKALIQEFVNACANPINAEKQKMVPSGFTFEQAQGYAEGLDSVRDLVAKNAEPLMIVEEATA